MRKKRVKPQVKTYIRISLAVLGGLALIATIIAASQVHDVELTVTQIQAQIDKRLPLTKKGVTFERARIQLTDALNVDLAANGQKLGQRFAAEIQAQAKLRYDSGDFYLLPAKLHLKRFSLNGQSAGQAVQNTINKVTGSRAVNEEIDGLNQKKGLRGAVGRWLARKRDQLADPDSDSAAAIQKRAEALVTAGAEYALSRIPVYSLPDNLKGAAIGLMIRDIEITNGKLVVHLSFWQLGLTVLLLLGLAIGLIAMIIWCPQVFGLFLEFTAEAVVATAEVIGEIAD